MKGLGALSNWHVTTVVVGNEKLKLVDGQKRSVDRELKRWVVVGQDPRALVTVLNEEISTVNISIQHHIGV